jgi:hypothetical protein
MPYFKGHCCTYSTVCTNIHVLYVQRGNLSDPNTSIGTNLCLFFCYIPLIGEFLPPPPLKISGGGGGVLKKKKNTDFKK